MYGPEEEEEVFNSSFWSDGETQEDPEEEEEEVERTFGGRRLHRKDLQPLEDDDQDTRVTSFTAEEVHGGDGPDQEDLEEQEEQEDLEDQEEQEDLEEQEDQEEQEDLELLWPDDEDDVSCCGRRIVEEQKEEEDLQDLVLVDRKTPLPQCTPIDLHERLDDLHLSAGQDSQSDSESDGAGETLSGGSLSSASDVGHMTRSRSDGDLRSRPSSFIRAAPSRRGPKKTDPVAMYFQYKQLWEMFKAPGEEDHRELRRRIRERLAQQPPPFRRSRAAPPGSYVVPTEKKRSALRWRIRSKMAAAPRDHNNFYCSF